MTDVGISCHMIAESGSWDTNYSNFLVSLHVLFFLFLPHCSIAAGHGGRLYYKGANREEEARMHGLRYWVATKQLFE